jgi:hypothetical protein
MTYRITCIISLFFFVLTALSCSAVSRSKNRQEFRKIVFKRGMSSKDYVDHLTYLAKDYLSQPDVKTIRLSKASKSYLHKIYNRLIINNELILRSNSRPKFFIVKSNFPFYFSLPNSYFFFSTKLFRKYLKSEDILISVIAREIVKSHRNAYPRNIIVPTGALSTERMLQITRVPLEVKIELDKWAFLIIKRSGYDGFAFLNWLQVQNKHTLDFTLQLKNAREISKEEFLFKNFIVQENQSDNDLKRPLKNSSKEFYSLLRELKRRSNETGGV